MPKKKRTQCIISDLFPSLEILKKYFFIDLEKQEVTRLSTNRTLKPYLVEADRPVEQRHYAICYCVGGKKYNLSLHRLFFYWHNGYLPKLVDHRDTNPQNNKIENLRELNKSGNSRNSKKIKGASSKYKGVSWSKQTKKWVTYINVDSKNKFIKYCIDEDEAGQAYNDAVRKYGLEDISILNDTPQERARQINQFDSLPQEINHIKDLFI